MKNMPKKKRKQIKYCYASDLYDKAVEISNLMFPHIDVSRIKCFRSVGSSTKGTIARCHGMAKIMQLTAEISPHYAIEFISERFDKMSQEDQVKVIIHELMHIPFNFGGGFKHHNYVTEKNVNQMYVCYLKEKRKYKRANEEKNFLFRRKKIEESNNEREKKDWRDLFKTQ